MKQSIFKILFATLILITSPVLAQDASNQYEKAKVEILKLINLPNPMFSPDVIQESISEEAIADLGFEQIYKNSNGKVYIIENETHNGVRHNKKTMDIVSQWINNYKLQ